MTRNFVRFPVEATAGLNFQVVVEHVAGDTLTALLRGPGAVTLAASADGSTYTFAAAAAETAIWAPGLYGVSVRAARGDDVFELYAGQLRVLPDLAGVGAGFDPRTDNERGLDAVNAVLTNKASQDQMRYRINNRELWRMPVADLLKLKSMYTAAVRRERARASGRSRFGRAIPVVFR